MRRTPFKRQAKNTSMLTAAVQDATTGLNHNTMGALKLRQEFSSNGHIILTGALGEQEIRALRAECAQLLSTGESPAAQAVQRGCIIEPMSPFSLDEHVRQDGAAFRYGRHKTAK